MTPNDPFENILHKERYQRGFPLRLCIGALIITAAALGASAAGIQWNARACHARATSSGLAVRQRRNRLDMAPALARRRPLTRTGFTPSVMARFFRDRRISCTRNHRRSIPVRRFHRSHNRPSRIAVRNRSFRTRGHLMGKTAAPNINCRVLNLVSSSVAHRRIYLDHIAYKHIAHLDQFYSSRING